MSFTLKEELPLLKKSLVSFSFFLSCNIRICSLPPWFNFPLVIYFLRFCLKEKDQIVLEMSESDNLRECNINLFCLTAIY